MQQTVQRSFLMLLLLEGTSGYTRTELQAHAAKVLYHDEGMPSMKPIVVLLPPIKLMNVACHH